MKAIYKDNLYRIIDTFGNYIILEGTDHEFTVPLNDPTLIIDPTDGDIDNLRYPD